MKKLPLSCVPIGAVGFVDCVADINSKKRLVEMGFTKKARRTLITRAIKGDHDLIIVTFNCGNDFEFHKKRY